MDLSAKLVNEAGCRLMRGGAFKPRTSPYAFQGRRGRAGHVPQSGGQFKLPIVTELMDVRQIDAFLEYDVDVIQIGTRHMQNFDLLKEVGHINKPVILKRGMSATISEGHGGRIHRRARQPQRDVCERGIRTFETATATCWT